MRTSTRNFLKNLLPPALADMFSESSWFRQSSRLKGVDSVSSGGPPKLHLGCGEEVWEDYLNIDRDPATGADLVIDFLEIDRFVEPDTVIEVCMIHSLGYLNLWQARHLFRKLHVLMRSGAKLIIELPDVLKCAELIMRADRKLDEYLEGIRGIYAFSLEEVANRDHYKPYAFGWTAWHLQEELQNAGFADLKLLPPQTHGRPWRDIRVEAMKL